MKRAISEAQKGIKNGDGGPFGAIIVKNGKVIAAAHNTVIISGDPTAHAELNAIRRAAKKLKTYDLNGCSIYSTGEPCPMCAAAIKWANIGEVYYGCLCDDADKIGFRDKTLEIKSNNLETNIDREECLKLYGEWMNNPLKKIY